MTVKPLGALGGAAGRAAAGVVTHGQAVGAAAVSALWTFPSILLSAFLVAWGAEAAQFLISQGLALAALAWLQTLPEFAVEAVIAWEAGKDPARMHLAIANLTGAIRLLVGLAWPMIYFVAAFFGRKTRGRLPTITLDREHAIEVMGLLPPLLYFTIVLIKGSISVADGAVLVVMYLGYLWFLLKVPPHAEEELADAPAVSRWAYNLGGARRVAAIVGLFLLGGALLYLTAAPFLESMLGIAAMLGVSDFVFVQWVAPFLSEFPEKVSAFSWARRVDRAPMALMNMVSSNINQWTILAAMIPLVFGWSHAAAGGGWVAFHFDPEQQLEIALTLAQSLVAMLLLMEMRFDWWEAAGLFLLWLVQFGWPGTREAVAALYLAWAAGIMVAALTGRRALRAPHIFLEVVRESRRHRSTAKRSPRA
jgi:cation:H+ antiporter